MIGKQVRDKGPCPPRCHHRRPCLLADNRIVTVEDARVDHRITHHPYCEQDSGANHLYRQLHGVIGILKALTKMRSWIRRTWTRRVNPGSVWPRCPRIHRDLTAAAENICCRQAAARLPASELFGPRQSGNEDKGPCLACPGLAHDLTGGLARAARRKKRS